MGKYEDLERLREVIREEFGGVTEHIKHGRGGRVQVPIPEIPEYEYGESTGSLIQGDPVDGMGGQGQPQPGQGGDDAGQGDDDGRPAPGTPVPGQGDGDGEGEGDDEGDDDAGEGSGSHGYMGMSDEDFAELLEDELGFELDPTEQEEISEEKEGDLKEEQRTGPRSLEREKKTRKNAYKRAIAQHKETDYIQEMLKIDGVGPEEAFRWARNMDIDGDIPGADEQLDPPIRNMLENEFEDLYEEIADDERDTYEDFEAFLDEVERQTVPRKILKGEKKMEYRPEDRSYHATETDQEEDTQLVVVNIRDVSGSMNEQRRDFTERVFWPINKYLKGKYDEGAIIYVAHDHDAWEVEEADFWGMTAGGGTRIESAYELTQAIFDGDMEDYNSENGTKDGEPRINTEDHPSEGYPAEDWNRYVFGAGDGGNTTPYDDLPELMREIDANRHGYVDILPWGGSKSDQMEVLEDELGDEDGYVFSTVNDRDDIIETIKYFLDEGGDD